MKILILFFSFVIFFPSNGFAKNSPENFYLKGEKYFQSGKLPKAEIFYQKAVNADPDNGKYWVALGMTQDAQGNFDAAIASYEKSLSLKNTEKHIAYNNLGVSYGKKKEHAKAIKAFQSSLKLDPEYAGAYYNLGVAYYRQGNKKAARAQFQKLKSMGQMDLAQVLWEKIYK